MFRVKICGITTTEDACAVAAVGADAVGLNFFEKSPRFLAPGNADAVAEALPEEIVKVGLFVNATAELILETWDDLGLDLIQLHGDEPPEFLGELKGRPVMRAFRLGEEGLAPILKYLESCRELGCLPKLVLIDSFRKGQYGGTGATADWDTAKRYPSKAWHPQLVLAGGLTAENVAAAIRAVRPTAVDTASGVEMAPGKKDGETVRQFVRVAREAFRAIS
jgi:phosphoribosylanthranilate isomerase